jgi:hypothetical protein
MPRDDMEDSTWESLRTRNLPTIRRNTHDELTWDDNAWMKNRFQEALTDPNSEYGRVVQFEKEFDEVCEQTRQIHATQEQRAKQLHERESNLAFQRKKLTAKTANPKIRAARAEQAKIEIERLEKEIKEDQEELTKLLCTGLPHEQQRQALLEQAEIRTGRILNRLNDLVHIFNLRSPRIITRDELLEFQILISSFTRISKTVADKRKLSTMIGAFLTSSHLAGVENGVTVVPDDTLLYFASDLDIALDLTRGDILYETNEIQRGEAVWILPDSEIERLNREAAGLGAAQRAMDGQVTHPTAAQGLGICSLTSVV